jgi:APA family basic amino acid/polyamine antiporter
MFLAANTIGPGVIALAFGAYLHASVAVVPARVAAVLAALAMTGLNAFGIRRSVRVTDVVVVLSIVSLVSVIVIGLPQARFSNLEPFAPQGVGGTLQATALLFFAYTGYSRIATLVEEVRNPKKTIPRATVLALSTATILYMGVAIVVLAVLGASGVSHSSSPLQSAMAAVGSVVGVAIVVLGAMLTTFNEGLSDLLGVSRVAFAMAREGDLPTGIAILGAGQNPWRSVLLVGVVSVVVAGLAPFGTAVAVSSFGTLLYYSVTNTSALKLAGDQRSFPRALAYGGLVGCLGLALSLSPNDIALGVGILAIGLLARWVRLNFLARGTKPVNVKNPLGPSKAQRVISHRIVLPKADDVSFRVFEVGGEPHVADGCLPSSDLPP